MEIARPPVGEEDGTVWRGEASRPARHSIICATLSFTYSSMKVMKQDSSFSYFVFLWLQSPQRGCHWNRREAAAIRLDEGARVRRAGRPPVTAGSAGKVLRHVTTATLFCFGDFMKKEGRSGTAGGGDSWRALLSRSVAADKPGGGGGGLVGLGGGRKNGNDEDKSGERKRGLWLRASWEVVEQVMAVLLLPPSSFFSISFSRLVKNFTKRNFIFPSHPTPVFARHGAAELPSPVAIAIVMSP